MTDNEREKFKKALLEFVEDTVVLSKDGLATPEQCKALAEVAKILAAISF